MPQGMDSRQSFFTYTGLAQLVEHRSPKPSVGSSSLSSRAKKKYNEETKTAYEYRRVL